MLHNNTIKEAVIKSHLKYRNRSDFFFKETHDRLFVKKSFKYY